MKNVEDIYKLTPVQEGILFHALAAPNSGAYIEQLVHTFHGAFEPARFQAAWDKVFVRHTALRSIFLWDEIDEPLQIVRQQVALPWQFEDWRERDAQTQETDFSTLLATDRRQGFDLAQAPLSRMRLIRIGESQWQFLWTFHHLLLDGWSVALVIREVLLLYSDQNQSLPKARPFNDYVAWLQAEDDQQSEAYWKETLAGFTETTRLNIVHEANEPDGYQRTEHFVDPQLMESVKKVARKHEVTLNTIIHGIWALVLSRYTNQDDLVFGSTLSGRPASLPGIESLIGCCINTLPFRVQVAEQESLFDWLSALQQSHLRMRGHESSSLRAIQSWSALPTGSPLFESLVVLENFPESLTELEELGLSLNDLDIHEQSNFPLALIVVPEKERLRLLLNHETETIDSFMANELLDYIETLLRWFVQFPEARLSGRPALTIKAQEKLNTWSKVPKITNLAETSILALIQDQCGKRPDHIAMIHRGREWSYQEMDHRANALAKRLLDMGISRGHRVGLCVERSPEMIIGILGIMKVGGAYLPLDPTYPERRLQALLDDSKANAVVTSRRSALDFGERSKIFFEDTEALEPACPTSEPAHSEDLAYIIYTSGSTGKPKGVGVTHANLLHSNEARFEYYQQPVGRFLLLSSMTFDSSVAGIFWTLATGGALVLPEQNQEQDIAILSDLVATHQVTHTLCLPSLYDLILQHAPPEKLASFKVVIVAGESCPASLCQRHHRTLPHTALHNEYGPTEATVWCSAWESVPTSTLKRIPIGRPSPGTEICVLDSKRKPTPLGVAGELHIGGDGVVPGYLNGSEITNKAFIAHPSGGQGRLYRTGDRACWLPDGNLMFLGRADEQIKVRGYRIEPAEIESALLELSDISEAVILTEDQLEDADITTLTEALATMNSAEVRELLLEVTA